MRLLIADDEENLAQALKAVLEDAGYNCDVCYDGNSAIHLISQEIYDMALSLLAKRWKSSSTTLPLRSVRWRVTPLLSSSARSMQPFTLTLLASICCEAIWFSMMRMSFMPCMAMLWRFLPRSALG